jgi:hypothetical protein
MDKKVLVKFIRETLEEFDVGNRGYNFIMLVSLDPFKLDSKIRLYISAAWLDNQSLKETLDSLVAILKKKLKKKLSQIFSIHLIKSSDPLIKSLVSNFRVDEGSPLDIRNLNIEGFEVEDGVILKAGENGFLQTTNKLP